jgi:hypothetical protein
VGEVGIGTERSGDMCRGARAITDDVRDAQFCEGGTHLGDAHASGDVVDGDLGRHQSVCELLEPSADGHCGQGDAAGRQCHGIYHLFS